MGEFPCALFLLVPCPFFFFGVPMRCRAIPVRSHACSNSFPMHSFIRSLHRAFPVRSLVRFPMQSDCSCEFPTRFLARYTVKTGEGMATRRLYTVRPCCSFLVRSFINAFRVNSLWVSPCISSCVPYTIVPCLFPCVYSSVLPNALRRDP